MHVRTSTRASRLTALLSATSLSLAALLAGCSGSVTSGVTNITSQAVSVPVLITDAPSDQLVSFSLTLNSITLTDSAGKTASVLSSPTTIEICHLNGVQAPLVTASIPQDTYTSATFTFSNPQITYINSSGQAVVATPTLATTSFTLTFPSAITISNSSTSLLVDLIASQSVTISGTTITVSPVFSVKPIPAATAAPTLGSNNGTGMEQHGAVVSASGTTLVIQPQSGATVTFTTNSSTQYQGVSSLSGLTAGELVEVDFVVQSGGTLLATRVQLCPPPNGVAATAVNLITGPVTSVSSGSFKMAAMLGLGSGVPASATGTVFTVTTTGSTTYAITQQFQSLGGLPFTPTFTATNLTAGQNVAVTASAISASAGTATAATVTLVPQTLGGTVSAIASGSGYTAYTLTLASGSAFATLSGASTVTVYTSSATAAMASNAIAVGSTVRFNGPVFNLGSGKFAMVAGCSPDGVPGH